MQIHNLGQTIKSLREDKGLTQQQLAKVAGISRVTLGKIERGEFGHTTVRVLDMILDKLGYEIEIKIKSGFGLPALDER